MTRLGIEVQNLKMRVESLSSRLDFDERRARALEGVVQYRRRTSPRRPSQVRVQPSVRRGSDVRPTAVRAVPRRQSPATPSRSGRTPRRAPRPTAQGSEARAEAAGPAARRRVAGAARRRRRRPGQTHGGSARRWQSGRIGAVRRRLGDVRARRRRRRPGRIRTTEPPISEARGRCSALRRGHQRRRRAARPLHRRTAGAARRGRGPDDLRARLHHVAERAACGRRDGQRRARAAVSGRRARATPTSSDAARSCVFEQPHSIADELSWLESEGPTQPGADPAHRDASRDAVRFLRLLQLPLLPRVARRARACRRRRCSCRRPSATRRSGSSIFAPDVPRRARASCTTRSKSAR